MSQVHERIDNPSKELWNKKVLVVDTSASNGVTITFDDKTTIWIEGNQVHRVKKYKDPNKCNYCENAAKKTLVWLYDKSHQPAEIKLPWCGCDLMTALRRIWPCPYQVEEGVDYRVEAREVVHT